MSLTNDLNTIKTVQDGVKNNKVTRFAYTQTAYDNNDVNGHDDYVATRDNNIPLSDLSVIEVNPTVVDKGFRARASALNRMFLNHLFGRISYNLNKVNDLFNDLLVKIVANLGVADGLATLDSTGRIPYSQLPEDAMEYQGDWNASTNTPTLADGTGTKGDTYNVSVAGTQTFGGISVHFAVGDRVIYNGSVWQKFASGDVQSVCEILPDPATANVDLSQQEDITKIFNSGFLSKLFLPFWYKKWKTARSPVNGTTRDWTALRYGNGIYVACTDYQIFSSPDGINWTERKNNLSNFRSLTFVPNVDGNEGIFLAGFVTSGTGGLWQSTDGINWLSKLPVPTGVDCGVYGDSNILLASSSSASGANTGLFCSLDKGESWYQPIRPSSNVNGGGLWSIASDNNGLIRGVGDSRFMEYNGTNYSTFKHSSVTSMQVVIFGKGVWVIGTRSQGIYVWSPTFDSFNVWQVLNVSGTCRAIAFDGNMFVAGIGGVLYYSYNGTAWYRGVNISGVSPREIMTIINTDNGVWLASSSDSYILMSTDGINWQAVPSPVTAYSVNKGKEDSEVKAFIVGAPTTTSFVGYSGRQEMLEYLNGE